MATKTVTIEKGLAIKLNEFFKDIEDVVGGDKNLQTKLNSIKQDIRDRGCKGGDVTTIAECENGL